jgi:hypothetical protein
MLVVCICARGALRLTRLCVFHTGQVRSCSNAVWSTFVFRMIRGERRPTCLTSCSVEFKLQNESTQMFSYSALLITLKILTQLTPWNEASLGSNGIPSFYGSRRLIAVLKEAHHWIICRTTSDCNRIIFLVSYTQVCISQLISSRSCMYIISIGRLLILIWHHFNMRWDQW